MVTEDDREIFTRLGKVETEVASIKASLSHMEVGIRSLVQKAEGQQPDMRLWASWAGVVLSVVTVVGALAIMPIKEKQEMFYDDVRAMRVLDEESMKDRASVKEKINQYKASFDERIEALRERVFAAEQHATLLGHPHVQTERIDGVTRLLEAKSSDRFTGAEARLLDRRLTMMEEDSHNEKG